LEKVGLKKYILKKISSNSLHLIYPSNYENTEIATNILLSKLVKQYPIFIGHLEGAFQLVALLEHDFPLLRTK
jgi:hypothetical protein